MGLERVGLVVLASLTVASCDPASPRTTPAPATTTAAASAVPASPAGPVFKASPLDLCTKTDLAPLADLSLKLQRKEDSPPIGEAGVGCLFTFESADGKLSSLRVEAMALSSVDEAKRAFKAQQEVSVTKSDGPVSGVGDQAEGRTLDREYDPTFKQSEYMVHGRSGNLTFKAWVAVGGKAFTPKDKLAPKVNAMAQALLATVNSAWLQK